MSPIKPTEFHNWSKLPTELQLQALEEIKRPVDFFNAARTNSQICAMMNDVSQIEKWIGLGVKPPISHSGMQNSVMNKIESFDPYVQKIVLNLEEPVDIFSESFGEMNRLMVLSRRYAAEGYIASMKHEIRKAVRYAKNAGLEKAPELSDEELKSAYLRAMNETMVSAEKHAAHWCVDSMKHALRDAAKYANKAGVKMPRLLTERMNPVVRNAYVRTMSRLGYSLDP